MVFEWLCLTEVTWAHLTMMSSLAGRRRLAGIATSDPQGILR